MLKRIYIFAGLLLLLLASITVSAQSESTVLVDGLASPRQISYGDDGVLYISEAGVGGDALTILQEDQGVLSGLTSRISAVSSDGELSVLIPTLPSTETRPNNTGYRGAQAVLVTDDLVWVAFGESVNTNIEIFPFFTQVIGFSRETNRIVHVIDTLAAELEQNPDGDALASDPTDLVIDENGTLWIADAGANSLWTWTSEGGLELFHNWTSEDNPVPTSVALGMNGEIFVGFLTGFPFPENGARVERWSGDGELLQTFEGFNLVTDVLLDGNDLYIVEMASGLGDAGFVPDSGRVLRINYESGGEAEVVADGLPFPYGIAMSPEGMLAVSTNTAFSSEPIGQILMIDPS